MGIHYRFVVIPNKESILPEKIADKFQKNDHRIVHQVFDLSKYKIHSIILEDFFLNHPRRLELYDKEDTHYNFLGALVTANYIIDSMHPSLNFSKIHPSDYVLENIKKSDADLSTKMNPPYAGHSIVLEFKNGKSAPAFRNNISNHGHVTIMKGGNPKGPSVLLFGDSFSDFLAIVLAEKTRRLVRVHTTSIDIEIVYRERPDIVLSETVERFLLSPPTAMPEFSYKNDATSKISRMSPPERQALRKHLRTFREPENLSYAADILAILERLPAP